MCSYQLVLCSIIHWLAAKWWGGDLFFAEIDEFTDAAVGVRFDPFLDGFFELIGVKHEASFLCLQQCIYHTVRLRSEEALVKMFATRLNGTNRAIFWTELQSLMLPSQ